MGDSDEYLLLSTLLRELRDEHDEQKAPSYQRLWVAIVEGAIPARFDRNKWWVRRGDKPIAAQVLGLIKTKGRRPRTRTTAA